MFWQASAACASCGASVLVRPWPGLTATRLACTAGWGLGRGTGGGGEEGPGCACPAPARISAMADRHRAHDPKFQSVRCPGKTAGIMIRSRVNLWCRDHDPGSFCVAGIVLVVAREIPAAICNPGPLTTPRV